jgi:hypothetical protein
MNPNSTEEQTSITSITQEPITVPNQTDTVDSASVAVLQVVKHDWARSQLGIW